MKIKRTWNKRSLRAGQSEIIDESKARLVIGQTALAQHEKGECPDPICHYCPEPSMRRLLAGAKLEQFFCTLELVSDDVD